MCTFKWFLFIGLVAASVAEESSIHHWLDETNTAISNYPTIEELEENGDDRFNDFLEQLKGIIGAKITYAINTTAMQQTEVESFSPEEAFENLKETMQLSYFSPESEDKHFEMFTNNLNELDNDLAKLMKTVLAMAYVLGVDKYANQYSEPEDESLIPEYNFIWPQPSSEEEEEEEETEEGMTTQYYDTDAQ